MVWTRVEISGILGNATWSPYSKQSRQRWSNIIKEDLRNIGVENTEEISMGRAKNKWKNVVVVAKDLNNIDIPKNKK